MRKGIAGLLIAGILPKLIFLVVVAVIAKIITDNFKPICWIAESYMGSGCWWLQWALIVLVAYWIMK